MTVPVSIADRGPYKFIIDTGSERTVISRELARNLGLAAGKQVNVIAMSGAARVDSVIIPSIRVSAVPGIGEIRAPALGALDLGGLGLLGIDTLRNHMVAIDFDDNTMTVQPSSKREKKTRSTSDEIVITAKSSMGQLIVTDAEFDGRPIRVVIDTGSPVSVANSAMKRLVARRTKAITPVQLTSAIGGTVAAQYTSVGDIRIGDVRFSDMPIAFADVAPFERFALSKRPAMMLGMSALRSFRRVEIDFANRQIRFQLPRALARG